MSVCCGRWDARSELNAVGSVQANCGSMNYKVPLREVSPFLPGVTQVEWD